MQKNQMLFITSLIFAIIVTLFALTNSEPVAINLLFYSFVASQALVIFVSTALGAIIVTTLGLTRYIRLTKELKTLRKEHDLLKIKPEAIEVSEEHPVIQDANKIL